MPYPPALTAFLAELPLASLGPGTPIDSARATLSDASLLTGAAHPDACRAGLWLAFGFLDESHAISQELHTPEGSYWHALMHRREPDGANAKYWFRKVGTHPIYAELARDAAELRYLGMGMAWDPFTFVDHCDEFRDTGTDAEETCKRVQRREWELLFAWCYGQVEGT